MLGEIGEQSFGYTFFFFAHEYLCQEITEISNRRWTSLMSDVV